MFLIKSKWDPDVNINKKIKIHFTYSHFSCTKMRKFTLRVKSPSKWDIGLVEVWYQNKNVLKSSLNKQKGIVLA